MREKKFLVMAFLKIVMATDRAFLIRMEDEQEYWVPRSQVQEADDFEAGDTHGEICISTWFLDRMEPAAPRTQGLDRKAYGKNEEEEQPT